MNNTVPTPVLPDFARMTARAQAAALSVSQQSAMYAYKSLPLLAGLANPGAAGETFSRLVSKTLQTQVILGFTAMKFMEESFDESVRVVESLPLGKEALGPLPSQTRQALSATSHALGEFGRQFAGKAFAF